MWSLILNSISDINDVGSSTLLVVEFFQTGEIIRKYSICRLNKLKFGYVRYNKVKYDTIWYNTLKMIV